MRNFNVAGIIAGANTMVKGAEEMTKKTLLEQAKDAEQARKDAINLIVEENKTLFAKETGANLRIYRYEDIITGGQVLFYNGVDKELAVGNMTIDIKKVSNIIDIFDKELKDTDIVDIEILGRVFDLTQWFEIVDGKYIPKKHISLGLRYGRTVNGEYVSRIERENITKFTIETEQGYKQRATAISNKIAKKFDFILSRLDLTCQTVADIKLLISDMQHIGRQLQETGIDADKKFSLVIPMRLAKYINKETKIMSSYLKKNGKDVVKSNLDELLDALLNNEDVSEFGYEIKLDTDKDLIADGGRYWRTIADANSEVMMEEVFPVLQNAKVVDELAELIKIANTDEITREFTKYCAKKLVAYRNYSWNTKFSGEDQDEDKKRLHAKADNHEEIRIAFKCTMKDTGRRLGLDDKTILACVIAADCTDKNGDMLLKNEKMTGRQLFKHEFADFYRGLGRTVVAFDGSRKEVKPEKVFYGETKAYGVTDEVFNKLAAYEALNRKLQQNYMDAVMDVFNKVEGAAKTVAEIEIPETQALEVEFFNGHALVEGANIYAKGIDGKAYLFLKDNDNVVAAKEYDPAELAANEKFEGRLLVLDKCLSVNSKNVGGAVTELDFMDVKFYKERQAKDSNKSVESNKGKDLRTSMEGIEKLIGMYDNKVSIFNCSQTGLKNVITIRREGKDVRPFATFQPCGDFDALVSIIGKKKVEKHLEKLSKDQLLATFRSAKEKPLAINSIDVKVKHFEFAAGSAFMILED